MNELPKGWERVPGESYRKGDITVYRILAWGAEWWFASTPPWAKKQIHRGMFTTAREAMAALDREYPMEPGR